MAWIIFCMQAWFFLGQKNPPTFIKNIYIVRVNYRHTHNTDLKTDINIPFILFYP